MSTRENVSTSLVRQITIVVRIDQILKNKFHKFHYKIIFQSL